MVVANTHLRQPPFNGDEATLGSTYCEDFIQYTTSRFEASHRSRNAYSCWVRCTVALRVKAKAMLGLEKAQARKKRLRKVAV